MCSTMVQSMGLEKPLQLTSIKDEPPMLTNMLLEEWFSTPMTESKIATAAPIIATTITLEAIQNVLHASGFPIDAHNMDIDFGPFDDTQFDAVVDVVTSSQGKGTKEDDFGKDMFYRDYDDSLPDCSDISDLSEDDVLSILHDSEVLGSDSEKDYDSGIEAEIEDRKDGRVGKDSIKKLTKTSIKVERNEKDSTSEEGNDSGCEKCGPPSTGGRRRKAKESNEGEIVTGCQFLWEFLHYLVSNKKYEKFIAWKNPQKGIFHMVDHNGVAKLWGKHKKRKNMTYDKLSRALRYYYSKEILAKVNGQRLTYKFCRTPCGTKYPS